MKNAVHSLKRWLSFAGFVLIVAVVYWAQAVFIPIAVAILLTFILTPPVSWLQRWFGRVAAVLFVVTLVFAGLGLAVWGISHEVANLATPSAPSKTRYVVRKLRAAVPELKIIVGRCAPPALADENPQLLVDAGVTYVAQTLLQLREQLRS